MIESAYWKEELLRIAKDLRPVPNPKRWTERGHAVLERDIMIGFFIVRRLVELKKVSSATANFVMDVFAAPATGKPVSYWSRHDIWEVYDLVKEKPERKKALYMSNQFIHAYTSSVQRDETRNWADVYVVSDFDRATCIWRVPTKQIRRLFQTAGEDYPHSMHMTYNPSRGDYDVTTN